MSRTRGFFLLLETVAALWLCVVLHQDRLWSARALLPAATTARNLFLRIEPGPASRPEGAGAGVEQAELLVFAPPQRRVSLQQNGIGIRSITLDKEGAARVGLLLRRGRNQIVAELEPRPGEAERDFPERASLEIDRVPVTPLRPTAIAWPSGEGGWVHALAEPRWAIELCVAGAGRGWSLIARTDEMGAFAFPAPAAGGQVGYRLLGPLDSVSLPGATPPAGRDCQLSDYPLTLAAAGVSGMERRLEVDLQEASIRIHASVRLPTETAAVEWAGRGQLAPRDFLRWLFGLSLGSDDPRPGRASAADPRPQFTREFDAATGTTVLMLEFTAPRSGFAFQTVQPALMSQPGDHVTIEAARQDRLQTGRPAPARTETDGRVRLEWQQVDAGSAGLQARLETPPPESAAAPGSPEDRANLGAQARQTSAITAVQRLRDVLPRRINEVGYWLLAAIPCLWFIAILRRNTAVAERVDMVRLATGLFMLHVAYVAVTAFEFDLYGLVAPWLAGRAQDEVGLARNVAVGLGGALPLATLAAWILFLRLDRWLPAAEPQAGHAQGRGWFLARLFFIWPLAVAVLALVVAGPFVLQGWAQASKVEWRNQVWVLAQVGPTGVALLLGWVFVYWCLRSATGRPGSVAVAWLVSWTLLIVPALPLVFDAGVEQLRQALLAHGLSPLLVPWNAGSAVWPAVCLLVGMSLSWAIGRRALKLIRWTPLAEWTPRTRRLVAASTLFVFALPMVDESGFATPWLLVHFHYYMLRLTPFVLLACLWALLRQANPEDRFRLSAVEADLGLLLFAFYLCGGATHLLLVPIPLITGWWLARHYLLRPVAIGPEAAPSKASILRSLVGLREAERLQAVLRRHSEKKYGEGAVSRDDYERGLALAAERVSAARRALHLGDREARRALFGHGPGTGPMANAWLAVRLGLPLIVLFQLAAIDRSLQVDVGRFPLLELVTPHVVTGSYWLVAAFLFGYFFHALRGGDGLSKGAAFGLSLLLPTLCVLVLNQQSLLAPTAAEQFLRIGLFASYLALSFDARVVRQAGFELRHLVLVYGIAPSFALASSLAALGGLSLAPVLKLAGCWSMRTLGFEVCAP